ncbi:MAG: hypothetical protein KatS3mg113_0940 [Planctomycetaceae bacterium]|nr:MAG: hypothetical protein KatS3mg113_0940 [Planctomycetaceae bacterium]
MIGEVIALIRDIDLFEQLDRRVRERFQSRLRFAGQAETARELLLQQPVPTLIVDSRPESCDQELIRFFEQLSSFKLPGLNLISVGTSAWPLAIAGWLDLLTLEHISLEEGQLCWAQTTERLARIFAANKARSLPPFRQVEAGGISLTTYTPEFFPCLDDLLRVTHRDVTLLLVGETGTGKTTLAKFIHYRSPRRERAFHHLACGTLPADLIESELFGHTRGAFTGAERNKIGRFQAAGQGTLLLDEIDVLDLKQQVKLLRVIETGEYELVGSTETHVSEARLIVASNVNLEELVAKGQFRSDLYYRLNVLEFHLPPLRQRHLDLVYLACQFALESCREHQIIIRGIERTVLDCLKGYSWPGNLRELKNHMQRAVLFCQGSIITLDDLSPKLIQAQFTPAQWTPEESREDDIRNNPVPASHSTESASSPSTLLSPASGPSSRLRSFTSAADAGRVVSPAPPPAAAQPQQPTRRMKPSESPHPAETTVVSFTMEPSVELQSEPVSGNHEPLRINEQVAQAERRLLLEALRRYDNNRTRTAQALGLSRVGLYKKMKRLGLISDEEP